MNTKNTAPFTSKFVLDVTYKQIMECIAYSNGKTVDRLGDDDKSLPTEDSAEKVNEIMGALATLNALKKHIEAFKEANPTLFAR